MLTWNIPKHLYKPLCCLCFVLCWDLQTKTCLFVGRSTFSQMPRSRSAKIWILLKPFPTTEVSSIHAVTHIHYCIVFVLSTSAFTKVSTDFFVQPTGFLILLHHSAAFNIFSCPSLLEISFSCVFRATLPSCFPPAFRLCFLYLDSFSFFHSLHATVPQDFGLKVSASLNSFNHSHQQSPLHLSY